MEAKLESKDLLETVTGSPSEQKAVKEEENKLKEKEEKIENDTLLMQQVGQVHSSKSNSFFFYLVGSHFGNNRDQIRSWFRFYDKISCRYVFIQSNR